MMLRMYEFLGQLMVSQFCVKSFLTTYLTEGAGCANNPVYVPKFWFDYMEAFDSR